MWCVPLGGLGNVGPRGDPRIVVDPYRPTGPLTRVKGRGVWFDSGVLDFGGRSDSEQLHWVPGWVLVEQ